MIQENVHEFLNNSSVGIHVVNPEGVIIYANQCELEILGYEEDEYVGHHVSEFLTDEDVLQDMMNRLSNLETLSNYPASMKGKTGCKYILYNSSVYTENGKFVHTRCFGKEIDAVVYEVVKKNFPYFNGGSTG